MNWKHKQLNVTGKCSDTNCEYCYPKIKSLIKSKFNWWPKLPRLRGNK